MASVERLGDIRRRKFDYHTLAAFGGLIYVFQTKERIQAKGLLFLENRGDKDFCEFVDFEEELEECAIERGGMHKRGLWEL